MPDVYALAADVDVVDGVPIGRLVYRYRLTEYGMLEPQRTARRLEYLYLEPHRRYWLGLDKPRFVRIVYWDESLSLFVFSWRKSRVSWYANTWLPPVGRVINGRLVMGQTLPEAT